MGLVLARGRRLSRFETPVVANDGVLPTEVLSEVLLYLPAKVLCRLRLVCRAWRVLTYDPSFVKAHSTRHPLFAAIRKQGGSEEIHMVDLFGHLVKRGRTEEAVHGYNILSTQPGLIFISGGETGAYVINLATDAVKVLPKLVIKHITFGPEYVLGYVPSIREYKVLRYTILLTDRGSDKLFHVITLGSGNGQWEAKAGPPMHISGLSSQIVVVDGVVYLSYKDCHTTSAAGISIVMFDLATEEWQPSTLQGPSCCAFSDAEKKVTKADYMTYRELVELNGCLVIVNRKWE